MQDHGEGLQPLAFMSKALKPPERRYSAYKRELAAIAYCFLQWRHYLEGCPGGVSVVTDHQPLTLLMQQATFSQVQSRWVRLGFFQSIQPSITYQPGKANVLADALSRSKWVELDSKETENMKEGNQAQEVAVMTRSSIVASKEIKEWKTAQEEDSVVRDTIERVRQRQERKAFALTPQGLLVQEMDSRRKLVVPQSLRQKVLASCHDEPTKGHAGIRKMEELTKQRYCWKGMGKDIQAYVRSCPICQVMKSDNRKKVGLLSANSNSQHRKWEQITTDLVTDLPPSGGYTAIAVFVDRLTKMVHFTPCTKEISADQVCSAICRQCILTTWHT